MSKRILFFGNERFATGIKTKAIIFEVLIAAGYEIQALIVSSSDKSLDDEPIVKIAKKNGIRVVNPSSLRDFAAEISGFNVDIAILAAYGKIVPQSILDLFKIGIVNIHPSLLPKHRGSTPIESVILANEKESGVSVMKLVKDMDAGPMYVQEAVKLTRTESKQDLADILSELGKNLLIANLDGIISQKLKPKAQPDHGATYDSLITKEESIIDWANPAALIDRQIRAYSGWPKSKTTISKINITITEAHILDLKGKPGQFFVIDKQLGFHTPKGSLIIDKLIPEGKNEMSAEGFLAGYKTKLSY